MCHLAETVRLLCSLLSPDPLLGCSYILNSDSMVKASRLSFNLRALGESIHEVRQQKDSYSEDPFTGCTTAEVCDDTINSRTCFCDAGLQ